MNEEKQNLVIPEKGIVRDFYNLAMQMTDLMARKNADYARGLDPFKNLRRHGVYGIVVRMDDKIARLDSLLNPTYAGASSPPAVNESIEDTAMDLATYALLLILMRRTL